MRYFKYKNNDLYCFIAFFLFCFQLQGFFGKYPIQNFSPIDYKAGIQNIDFAQNRDMTLFVANNLGVLSYNGNDWKVHALKSGKKERSLAFDENSNRLYVGSQGDFGYFIDDWNYVSLIEKIAPSSRDFDEVWDVFILNSKVYFCSFQSIYVYDGQSIYTIEYQGGFDRSFQINDKIFTQDKKGKLFEIVGQELIPTYPQALKNQIIAGIIPQDGGYLLFYNSGEIEFLAPFNATLKYFDLIQILKGKFVNHVLQLSDTRLAISTQTSGLFLYDLQKRTIENITKEDGLLTNVCLRSYQDYAGNLWVGMQNGISMIDINSPIRFINQDINIQGSGYEAFEVDSGTYYTTSNGIYFLAKNTTLSVFLPGTEGPAYGMQKIAGKLYAGHHTGLFLLENEEAKKLLNTEGLWQIKQLRSRPDYAIGGTYSGLYLFKINENNILQGIQKINGFNETSRFFEEDRKGRIWVGQFYKGLYQLNLDDELTNVKVVNISANYDFPLDEQIILCKIDDELHLATRAGIYHINQNNDKILKSKKFAADIGDQHVYLLTQDNQKNIHVFAENLTGFYSQVSVNNYLFVPSSLFQLRFYFNNDLLNISYNTNDGILYNANEGFLQFKPELKNRLTIEKPLLLSKVYSAVEDSILYTQKPFEAKLKNQEKIIVSPNAKVLKFEIESFQFNEVNNQQFRYFLKGFDQVFGEWTNSSTKEYTNLREGEYEFLAETRNYFGKIVTSEPIYLLVKPPFYRSLFARILYVIFGICTVFLISTLQKNRYKQKTNNLEKSKQQELAKIEQQNEMELRQMEEEKVNSELQHINNHLATLTMNLVAKNEFIESIKGKLKDVNLDGENKEAKKTLVQIVKDIDLTLRLQEDWEQFEYQFDLVHGGFLTRIRNEFVDLSPNEQKLCAFLRLNLNTKEIANLLGVSIRGVEVARYRLRKKLGLNKGKNLSIFILEY